MATPDVFQGIGPHALGEEAGLEQPEPGRDDEARSARYWLAYARGYGAKLPGWSGSRRASSRRRR